MVVAFLTSASPAQEIVIQAGHRGWITCATFRPDGRQAMTAASDGTLKLWDIESGRVIRSFSCYGRVLGMELSADGRTLAGGDINSSAMLLDVHRGEVLFQERLFDQGGYCRAAISPDGELFAGGGDHNVGVYRVADRTVVHHFEGPQQDRFYDVAFSPQGTHLAVASDERTVYLLELQDGLPEARRLTEHSGEVVRVLFHPDDRHLVSLVRSGEVTVWRWRSGENVRALDAPGRELQATSVALASEGSVLAVGEAGGRVTVFDFATGTIESDFVAHQQGVSALALHPAGELLLTGGEDGAVHLWEWKEGRRVRSLGGRELDSMAALGVTADGQAPVAVWDPGNASLKVWELRSKKVLWTASAVAGLANEPRVVFSPEATHVAISERDRPVQVWDLAGGKRSPAYEGGDHVKANGCLALGPDGGITAVRVREDQVALWRQDRTEPRTLSGLAHNDVLSMAFSADGSMLAQGGKGDLVHVLDVASGERRASTPQGAGWIFSLAFRRDGERLLCGGPYAALTLRSLPDLEVVRTMHGHRGGIRSVAFSSDGERLLSIGGEGSLRIWSAESGAELAEVRMLAEGQWLVTAPDGRWQASPRAADWASWSIADPDEGLRLQPLDSGLPDLRSTDLVEEVLGGR